MRIETLPSPGILSNGIKLRVEAAKAIGACETTAMRTAGGKTDSAGKLANFFTACAAALAGLSETTLPTITAQVATSATRIDLTFSEAMDIGVAPAAAAFAISGDTITGFYWVDATHGYLEGTGFAAAESLAYTQPGTNGLRDRSGNLVATAASLTLA